MVDTKQKETAEQPKPTEKKKYNFKNIKQIINAESQIKYPSDAVLYHHINAPPRLKPAMKVSDLSGIPTSYTDPSTQLNYVSSHEYRTIRYLPQHIVNGYLNLRGASTT